MNRIEILELNQCGFKDGLHDNILAFCSNLKRLELKDVCCIENGYTNKLYPKLEYFAIYGNYSFPPIESFLELNQNVRKLAIGMGQFRCEKAILKNANVTLDDLAIENESFRNFDECCYLLNVAHKRGLYKRLQLYFHKFKRDMVTQLALVLGLDKLYITNSDNVALSTLQNLNELCIPEMTSIQNFDALATNHTKLERIEVLNAMPGHILPFIGRTRQLKKIRIKNRWNADTNVIDLPTMNREREKLYGAQRVTLYVREDIYLATKWALIKTEFPLIALKRTDSYDWNHDFGHL